ncbi:MAG: HlyD family efflux transporter periplasmic adaptor subunit [Bacteroidales bacterium]
MKTYQILFLLVFVLASCSDSENLSDAYGNFEVDEVIISAEANGKLIQYSAREGLQLSKGQLVGIIDTTDFVLKRSQLIAQKTAISSNIKSIQSQIEVQEQQKKNRLTDKNRIEKLLKDGAATQKQLDDINGTIDLIDSQIASIQTQYTSIRAEMDVIKTQITQVEESIKKCHIYNPIDGVVLEKYAEQNEIAAFGRPLYKIANTDEMILRVYVSGGQLPNINIGQQVEVLIDQDEKTTRALSGEVTWVSDKAEFTPKIIQTKEERVNMVYAVKVRVKNDGSLKIGMPGEINF